MSVIKIKRSGVSGSPASLGQGELAYSYLDGTISNGGDRLYIGTGTETGGNAANIEVIGGVYFTSKLDHTPGTLTANSAIIVDSNLKIDVLNIDNITINGNAITSTDTNGNITISPNGSGTVDVDTSRIVNVSDPTSNQDAATKAYVDSQVGSVVSNFTIAGDSGTDTFETGQTLTFAGDTGITTAVSNNQVTIDLDDTAVTPGSYGNTTAIATFTVDQQGRLTAAGTAQIATGLSILGDSGTDTVNLLTDTLIFSGNTGITVNVSNNRVDIVGDDATTTTKGIASFNTNNFTVSTGAVTAKNITLGSSTLTLGSTTTAIAGITQFDVDNIRIDGNTISSTDTNGDITISPDGTGSVDVGSSRIINLATPTEATDAATKSYVDTIASASIHYHDPVRVETPSSEGSLDAAYNNGTAGVGATLTANSNEVLVIDGVTVDLNDRVLVYTQANAAHNGIYTVSQLGVSGTTPWVLTRATDADSFGSSDPDALGAGDAFFVKEGNTGAGELYVMNTEGTITFGTTEITFAQISSAQIYTAGDGLALSGVTFNVNVDDSSIEIVSDALRVKAAGITNDMLAGSIANAKLTNSTITVAGDSGSQAVDLGDTLTVAGSTGIATSVSGDTVTINLVTEAVQDIVGAFVAEGEGIDITYNDAGNTLTFSAEDATTSNKGVASFSSTNFTVTSGAVSIAAIDGGTY